jgi:heterodisulfide reductase subunit B
MSVRAVMRELEVELADERQFNCCGYPMRDTDQMAFLLSSARNLALAEKSGLKMLVMCKCCFGTLKKAQHIMSQEGELQDRVRDILKKEDLFLNGNTGVVHLLSLLYHDIGLDSLKSVIKRPFKDLNIAVHYGCHALRPGEITRFDDPVAPKIFDQLVEVTGAQSVDWNRKLDCCGSHAAGINDELSMELTGRKLAGAVEAKAGFMCTACPYCQIQFDTVQHKILSRRKEMNPLGSIIYSQLLGLAMGLDHEELGIQMNRIDIRNILSCFSED